MRRRLLAALAMALAGACAPAQEQEPGRDTILSSNPCIDAILERVADPEQIVGVSHYSHDPAAASVSLAWARRFPANGGTAEEIIAANPGLVLLGGHQGQHTIRAIRGAGISVRIIPVPETVQQSLHQVRLIAAASGHPERGEALVREIELALRAARPGNEQRIGAIIWQGEGLVPGSDTLAGEMLERTGFRNLSADFDLQRWDMLPAERLVAHPPDIIFHSRRLSRGPGLGPGRVLEKLAARSRMAPFPDRLLACAGPTLIDLAAHLRRHHVAFEGRSGR